MKISFKWDSELWPTANAMIFALEIHKGDKYGTHNFSKHLFEVIANISFFFKDDPDYDELVSIGWLHDTAEGHYPHVTKQTLLGYGFSEKVVDGVMAMTKKKDETYRNYIQRTARNSLALRVKIADSYANISQPDVNLFRLSRYSENIRYLTSLLPKKYFKKVK